MFTPALSCLLCTHAETRRRLSENDDRITYTRNTYYIIMRVSRDADDRVTLNRVSDFSAVFRPAE